MTTTVGIRTNDGVVLAADNRATKGYYIGSKIVRKIFQVDDALGVAIAGSMADAEYLVNVAKAERKLLTLRRGFPLSVAESAKLFTNLAYQGMKNFNPFFAELLVAGLDAQGPHVYASDMSGASLDEAFASSGSGSPIAYGVLEGGYTPALGLDEARTLAVKAVRSAIQRDPGSGNGVDILVISDHGPASYHEGVN